MPKKRKAIPQRLPAASYQHDVFVIQFPIVKQFIYHLTYYRALLTEYSARGVQDEFWSLTIDAHLLRATINWCMVFGSDNSNPIHWKKIFSAPSEKLYSRFRSGLYKEIGLDAQEWKAYWTAMIDFRNRYAAHRDGEYTNPVPHFDPALAAAFHYDQWVRTVIAPIPLDELPLKDFAESLRKAATPLAGKLLSVTRGSTGEQRK